MKIIRRRIFETNSSHGHSWHTNGVAYANTPVGEGSWTGLWQVPTKYANQWDIPYNLKIDDKQNFISITSNFDGTELIPVYIWKKTADPSSPSSVQNSIIEVKYLDKDQTYTMSVVSDGAANPTTNIIGSTQSLTAGFSLPPYTDTVFENSYMFQWQMSTDNFNWYDIIGANNSTYAVAYNSNNNNTDVTYYFRCLIYTPYNKDMMSLTSVVAIKFNKSSTTK